jgi:hypothetical protein
MRCPNNHDGTHFRRSYSATATDHRHGPAPSFTEYRDSLARAGFTGTIITPSHQVGDGVHAASILAIYQAGIEEGTPPVACHAAGLRPPGGGLCGPAARRLWGSRHVVIVAARVPGLAHLVEYECCMDGGEVAACIGRWRPSSVPSRTAAFARQVVRAAAPAGRERAKNLLRAAGRLADYAALPGLELIPETVLHPSVIERFALSAPRWWLCQTRRVPRLADIAIGQWPVIRYIAGGRLDGYAPGVQWPHVDSLARPHAPVRQRWLHEYVKRKYKRATTLGVDIGRYGERTSGERDNQTFGA